MANVSSKARVKVKGKTGVYYYPGQSGRCFYVTYRAYGKLRWEKVGWSYEGYTAKSAERVRGDRVRALYHGEELPEKKRDGLSLQEAFDKYIDWYKANKPNKKGYEADQWCFAKYYSLFANRPLKSITTEELEKLRGELVESMEINSALNVLSLIRKVYRRMVTMRLYKGVVPTDGMNFKRAYDRRERFLTEDECHKLLNISGTVSVDLWLAIRISLTMGLRQNEVLSLRGSDINLEGNFAVVKTKDSKTMEQTRHVPIPKSLQATFRDMELTNEPVIRDFNYGEYKACVKILGLNKGVQEGDRANTVVYHTLRHTFASRLAMNGRTLAEIRELLGHKSYEPTMRYVHLMPSKKQEAVDAIDL